MSQVAAVFSPVAFTVGANGNPSYQWRLNGTDIPGARSEEYLLPVPLSPAADTGAQFRCVVTDAAGNRVDSDEVVLTVLPQAQPTRLTVAVNGGNVTVRWPGEAGVQLQQASRLRPADWLDVPHPPGAGEVILPLAGPNAGPAAVSFRLVRRP